MTNVKCDDCEKTRAMTNGYSTMCMKHEMEARDADPKWKLKDMERLYAEGSITKEAIEQWRKAFEGVPG
jgi:molybdenum cofactor biosynthesis enzyme MoaA